MRITPQTGETTLPLDLAVVLDTSGSMKGEKLASAKAACRTLASLIRPQDRLWLASFSTRVNVLLDGTSDRSRAENAITNLTAEGITRTDLALDWIQRSLRTVNRTGNGNARVGIVITDGHPTNSSGKALENTSPLLDIASAISHHGITLCAVGLGNAANFNTAFLTGLSDRGRGAFIYADTPASLEPQLRDRLRACQTISSDDAVLRFKPMRGIEILGFCRIRPDYTPLEETRRNEIAIGALRNDQPTDILIHLRVPSTTSFFGNSASTEVMTMEFQSSDMTRPITASASLEHAQTAAQASQLNDDIGSDFCMWQVNLGASEVMTMNDLRKTDNLLSVMKQSAQQANRPDIAAKVDSQMEDLRKTGNLNHHKIADLIRDSRNLGEQL